MSQLNLAVESGDCAHPDIPIENKTMKRQKLGVMP